MKIEKNFFVGSTSKDVFLKGITSLVSPVWVTVFTPFSAHSNHIFCYNFSKRNRARFFRNVIDYFFSRSSFSDTRGITDFTLTKLTA